MLRRLVYVALVGLIAVMQIVMLPWLLVLAALAHRRAERTMMAYDQALNALTGGHEDETVSSRAARARDRGRRWGCVLCGVLDWLDPDHCNKSRGY